MPVSVPVSPGREPVVNPLDRFDLTNLWNDEDAPGQSQLAELIATVQEELENLEKVDTVEEVPTEADKELTEKDAKRLREQRLDRWLQQHAFSYSSIIDSASPTPLVYALYPVASCCSLLLLPSIRPPVPSRHSPNTLP